MRGVPTRKLTPEQVAAEFWRRVNKFGQIPEHRADLGPCWVWTGQLTKDGYGRVTYFRRMHLTHRVSFRYAHGDIPSGLELDHLCRNRACCNPSHLEPVTCAENLRRGLGTLNIGAVQRARTLCKSGHALVSLPSGQRGCRTCLNAAARARGLARRQRARDSQAAGGVQ